MHYLYVRFSCHFLFWWDTYRTSHFKCFSKVALHNNHLYSPSIFNFFIKLIIFNLKPALDIFYERANHFFFPFCMTADPSLRFLVLGNIPAYHTRSEESNHSWTQVFKVFEPQIKTSILWKRIQKFWNGIVKTLTIPFLWLLCINRYFFYRI